MSERRGLWIDASAGAAGDMLLGALLDAGASIEAVRDAVGRVAAAAGEPIEIEPAEVRRHGLRATRAVVRAPESEVHRTAAAVRELLRGAGLSPAVATLADAVFARLAAAEAAVHGEPEPDAVTLHEVGALDALADVVGCAAALDSLGVLGPPRHVVVGEVAVGSGAVQTRHGKLPVPAPAVLELLARSGARVLAGAAGRELCTPTGAALLVSLADEWGEMPPMRIEAVGVGAGSADPPDRANVVRVVLGRVVGSIAAIATPGADVRGAPRRDDLRQIEATVDDLDPRLWPDVLDGLVRAGAVDAWLTTVVMRKGRPGHVLTALAPPAALDAVARAVFEATTTLGLRVLAVERRALPRDEIVVAVEGCRVRVKRGFADGVAITVQPEYADAAEVAGRLGRPVRWVLDRAAAAALAEPAAIEGLRDAPAGPAVSDGGSTA